MRWVFVAALLAAACTPNGEMPRVGLPALETLILGVFIVGFLRNRLMQAINAFFAVLAWPFVVIARACQPAIAALSAAIDDAAAALRTYGGRLNDPAPLLFELIAPLVYLALFVIIALADFTVARLRFGALFGEAVSEADWFGINLADATGLLLIAVFIVLGYILFDALGIAPNRLPWGLLDSTWRARLIRGAWAGLILTAIATVAFFCWGQLQLLDDAERPLLLSTILEYLFIVPLAILLVATTLLSAWAVIVSAGALWAIVLFAVRILLWIVRALAVLGARGLDLAAALAVFVLDVIAAGPIWLKNWLAGYEALRRWLHLTPYEREARPPIDVDLDRPLFAPAASGSLAGERPLLEQGRQPEPTGRLPADAG
ncbi:MAG: hypothetical protein RMM58_01875 [Chloroflexota bacterium]|nr:hypothetical protein [Dehalococcoidia bacterium]MDW8252605.1 hypothetical protein [Chloroflexota bacterium]